MVHKIKKTMPAAPKRKTITNTINLPKQSTTTPKPHPKYRNIIFDVGNVLLEANRAKIIAAAYAQHTDVKVDAESILQFIGSDDWKRHSMGLISAKDLVTTIPAHINQKVFKTFLDLFPLSLTPLNEGIGILKTAKMRGYRVYILSNTTQERLNVIKQRYDFFKICDGEVFSCQVHAAKPDVAIYQILLKQYNLDPAECLFIDDMQKCIDAAKSVGIDGIVCTSHDFVKDELKRLGILD